MTPAAALALLLIGGACAQLRYYGKDLGPLAQLQHGVRGRVFAVDARTLYLQDFHYDGEGPAAYFYVGSSGSPSAGLSGAVRLRDERGGTSPLRKYRGESATLSLPDGKTLRDFKWFAVYCDEYSVNFGDVSIPRGVEYPRPAKVAPLRGVHGVSSDPVVVVDAQTLLVPNFSYDGEAPDAKFWVGRGDLPSPQGIRIPDENGKETPLRKYDKKTIVLTLPGELTVFDVGHLAVWCEAFTVNFGHVVLPSVALANVPPSLKMLGVSPQSKLNCEVLQDELAFEVRWAVAGDSIVVQLVAKLEDDEYMAFGISGSDKETRMVGGDPAVAWVDKDTLKGHAEDYYLDAKSQCAGVRGSCPDQRLAEGTNSIRPLNAALVNGYSIVTYQRPLRAADHLDRPVLTNVSQAIIWAIGPLNSKREVSYHPHYTKGNKFIEFGRPPVWNCPMPEDDDAAVTPAPPKTTTTAVPKPNQHRNVIKPNPVPTPSPVAKVTPWDIPAIQCYEPPDGVFYAQMGPTGGKQGYSAITGHVGWGISWYINGLLIPEIHVVRGRKYTFVVEGGTDPDVPARYHPFYITNDHVGGYFHKSDQEKEGVEIYAGVRRTRTGELIPTGVGRLCNWTPDKSGPPPEEYPSFGAYQRSLTLVCEEGNPGVVSWTPDKNTPDTVYYQCFTHRHLGWKIIVRDSCDESETDADESRVVQHAVLPDPMHFQESQQVHTRITPEPNFLNERKKLLKEIKTKMNYDNFSLKGDSVLTGEIFPNSDRTQYESKGQEYNELQPIPKIQMKDVIDAVESLENEMKDDMKRNASHYQVHEEYKEMFVPEQPIRADEEYYVDTGKLPNSYFLPANLKPLTLQAVLRPNSHKPMNNIRPFHRPTPPEIKLRRPGSVYQIGAINNKGYPLTLPGYRGHNAPMKKAPQKHAPNRVLPNVVRPPPPPITQMYPNRPPSFNQQLPKQIGKMPSIPSSQVQSIILGKPSSNTVQSSAGSQTLNLGQTDIIVNQVVKSQITLPGINDAIAQHSTVQTYLNKPGQIILGKPMDNPMPLDQQMIPTKQLIMTHTPSTSTLTPPYTPQEFHQETSNIDIQIESEQTSQNEIKSSDFIGESPQKAVIPAAVNTGFKPDSIVVESGFKPIIREPLMASVDRIADYEANVNRREDADIDEEYEESPQFISQKSTTVSHQYSSDKITETFEPMFIPSPPDHLIPTNDRTKEIFPKNHAKEDRPHPVFVNKDNGLFSKKNERDIPTDLLMESDRVSPQYLPPDPKVSTRVPSEHSQKLSQSSEKTFTSYDGKIVSAATLTSVPEESAERTNLFSSKLPANTELLLNTPQFGPFKGEIPPLVAAHILDESDERGELNIPIHESKTHLRPVKSHKSERPNHGGDLKAAGSKKVEVNKKAESNDDKYKYEKERTDYEGAEYYELDIGDLGEEDFKLRIRRNTKTAQFEKGEIEEMQTNGHSMPKNQVDFEMEHHATAAANTLRLYWMTHTILLLLSIKLL